MHAAIESARENRVPHIAFGDLFLEDIRAYCIKQLEGTGIEPLFPIWHEPTGSLARRMVEAGVEAVTTCIDPKQLPPSFVGRRFDHSFLDDLPERVDPCGENGEFHTCVLAGPMCLNAPSCSSCAEIAPRMPPRQGQDAEGSWDLLTHL